MLRPMINCAAQDVKLADLGEVHHSIAQILVATDGSEPAVRATQYAVLLAKLLNAKLEAVCVDVGFDELTVPESTTVEDCTESTDPCIFGLVLARDLCRANGVECRVRVLKGGVARNIIDAAAEVDAGVIVMGDTGRTGLKRLALGSVATAVIKASSVSVFVVKDDS